MIGDIEVKQSHLVRFQFGVFIKLQALSRSGGEWYCMCPSGYRYQYADSFKS